MPDSRHIRAKAELVLAPTPQSGNCKCHDTPDIHPLRSGADAEKMLSVDANAQIWAKLSTLSAVTHN